MFIKPPGYFTRPYGRSLPSRGTIIGGSVPAGPTAPTNTVAPALTGTGKVGSAQALSAGTWSETPVATERRYKRSGAIISGATGSSYTPVAADDLTTLVGEVRVQGANGEWSAWVPSAGMAITYPAPTSAGNLAAASLTVGNSASLDFAAQVTGSGGTWTVQSGSIPAGMSRTGGVVSGTPTAASSGTLVLRYANSGGFVDVSCAITVVVFQSTAAPSTSSPAKIGTAVTTSGATWSVTPDSIAHRWLRNGTAISGATASSYTPVAADDGTTLTYQIQATKGAVTTAWVSATALTVTYNAPTSAGDLAAVLLTRATATGSAINFAGQVSVSGGSGLTGVTISLDAASAPLPAGLSLSSGQIASGQTPTEITPQAPVIVRFANSGGAITVACPIGVRPQGSLAWWDFATDYQLRQAIAGTGAKPSAAADPVGYVYDQSGQSFHLAGLADASRLSWGPGYAQKAVSSNNALARTTTAIMKNASQFGVVFAFQIDTVASLGSIQHVFSINDGVTSGTARLSLRITTDGKVTALFRRADGGSSASIASAATCPTGSIVVVTLTANFTTNVISLQVNSLAAVTATGTLNGTSGAASANTDSLAVRIGDAPTAAAGPNQLLRIYEAACVDTVAEAAIVRDYMLAAYASAVSVVGTLGEPANTIRAQVDTGNLDLALAGVFSGSGLTYSVQTNPGGLSIQSGTHLRVPTGTRRSNASVVIRATNPGGAYADYTCALYVGSRIGMALPDDQYPGSDGAFDTMLDFFATLNIKALRTDLRWNDVETSAGVYSWPTKYTRLKARCAAKGVKILPVIHRTPTFHRLSGVTQAGGPGTPSAYAAFAMEVVSFFGESALVGLELWNEVNQATTTTGNGFWMTGRPVSELMAMHVAAYNAVKATYPSLLICSSGLSPVPEPGSSTHPSAQDTLQAMFDDATNPLLGKTDAIGFHPYWHGNDPTWGSTESWAGPQILRANLMPIASAEGGGSLPFWLTEIGSPTAGISGETPITQAQAAQGQLDAWLDSCTATYSRFDWHFIYSWKNRVSGETVPDGGTITAGTEEYFGITLSDGVTEKPACAVFRTMKRGDGGSPAGIGSMTIGSTFQVA